MVKRIFNAKFQNSNCCSFKVKRSILPLCLVFFLGYIFSLERFSQVPAVEVQDTDSTS